MSISFNTGNAATASTAASCPVGIPAGVLVADVMLMLLNLFTEDATQPAVSFAGAGGPWSLLAPTDGSVNPQVASSAGITQYAFAYIREASSGDPGATLTISEAGSPAATTWFAVALGAYTGAAAVQPDVAGGAEAFALSVTCPSLVTGPAGDWPVYLAAGSPGGGGGLTGPAGATQRENLVSAANVGAAIFDGNGPVGAGSPIGGGSFSAGSNAWWGAFTVGLKEAVPAAAAAAALAGPREEPLVTRWAPVPIPGRGLLWARP